MKIGTIIKVTTGLLVVVFILGVLATLYSKIPEDNPSQVFMQAGYISLHVFAAIALIVFGSILLVKARRTPAFKPAVGGMANAVLAFISGELVVVTGNDLFTFLMAICFVGAFASYGRLYVDSKNIKA